MAVVVVPRVDAYLHVWDLARGGYRWLTPEHGPLYGSFSPEQTRREMVGCGVHSAVLVQAEDSERDTMFLLDVAARCEWIAGVVGWVQLDSPLVAERQLDRRAPGPVFCGVRHLVHDDPRDDLLSLATVRRSLAAVAEQGLVLDEPDACRGTRRPQRTSLPRCQDCLSCCTTSASRPRTSCPGRAGAASWRR